MYSCLISPYSEYILALYISQLNTSVVQTAWIARRFEFLRHCLCACKGRGIEYFKTKIKI